MPTPTQVGGRRGVSLADAAMCVSGVGGSEGDLSVRVEPPLEPVSPPPPPPHLLTAASSATVTITAGIGALDTHRAHSRSPLPDGPIPVPAGSRKRASMPTRGPVGSRTAAVQPLAAWDAPTGSGDEASPLPPDSPTVHVRKLAVSTVIPGGSTPPSSDSSLPLPTAAAAAGSVSTGPTGSSAGPPSPRPLSLDHFTDVALTQSSWGRFSDLPLRVVHILRGLPGSGKTRLAAALLDQHQAQMRQALSTSEMRKITPAQSFGPSTTWTITVPAATHPLDADPQLAAPQPLQPTNSPSPMAPPTSPSAAAAAAAANKPVEVCTGAVVSSDKFFTGADGVYRFDGKFIAQAHASCLSHFIDAVVARVHCVAVDNTSSTRWEYANYAKLAAAHGYEVVVWELRCASIEMLQVFQARNPHAVPFPSCLAMWRRWEQDTQARVIKPVILEVPPNLHQLTQQQPPQQPTQQGSATTTTANTNLAPEKHIKPAFTASPSTVGRSVSLSSGTSSSSMTSAGSSIRSSLAPSVSQSEASSARSSPLLSAELASSSPEPAPRPPLSRPASMLERLDEDHAASLKPPISRSSSTSSTSAAAAAAAAAAALSVPSSPQRKMAERPKLAKGPLTKARPPLHVADSIRLISGAVAISAPGQQQQSYLLPTPHRAIAISRSGGGGPVVSTSPLSPAHHFLVGGETHSPPTPHSHASLNVAAPVFKPSPTAPPLLGSGIDFANSSQQNFSLPNNNGGHRPNVNMSNNASLARLSSAASSAFSPSPPSSPRIGGVGAGAGAGQPTLHSDSLFATTPALGHFRTPSPHAIEHALWQAAAAASGNVAPNSGGSAQHLYSGMAHLSVNVAPRENMHEVVTAMERERDRERAPPFYGGPGSRSLPTVTRSLSSDGDANRWEMQRLRSSTPAHVRHLHGPSRVIQPASGGYVDDASTAGGDYASRFLAASDVFGPRTLHSQFSSTSSTQTSSPSLSALGAESAMHFDPRRRSSTTSSHAGGDTWKESQLHDTIDEHRDELLTSEHPSPTHAEEMTLRAAHAHLYPHQPQTPPPVVDDEEDMRQQDKLYISLLTD